jgi:putative DNA primase/helicase
VGKALLEEKDLTLIEQTELYANLTDLGSKDRFVRQTDGTLRFLWERGKWLFYNGAVWQVDNSDKIAYQMAEETVRSIYAEASECEDKKDREAIADYAKKSESEAKIRAMLKLAKPPLSISIDELDRKPWLLNAMNGTINLKTGELQQHVSSDLISKIVPVRYDPTATCPEWIGFLNLIMDGNQEMLTFLQRAIGYSATGHTDERCIFILYGQGRNGKSTFTENIAYILPGYAVKTPAETLLIKKWGDGIPSDIARLKGARFVYASETGQNRQLNEARIKELTGDKDTLVGRFLHHEWFEFVPSFKLWLHTNHKPNIRGADQAIWDRIKLVPFTVRIPDEMIRPRREIDAIFEAERPGILSWLVQGCLDWQKHGLPNPDAVTQANTDYREESDTIKSFLDEVCIIEPSAQVAKNNLYEAYLNWAKNSGERFILNKNKLGKALFEKGFDDYRETGGKRRSYWLGLRIND